MKKLFLLSVIFGACTKPADDTRAIAAGVFEAFNAHDWSKMEAYYADSVELRDPAYPGGKIGKSGMTDFYQSVPDIHDEVVTLHASGNVAFIEFVSTGTIDGARFELPICTVLTIKNGRIVSDHTYYNQN